MLKYQYVTGTRIKLNDFYPIFDPTVFAEPLTRDVSYKSPALYYKSLQRFHSAPLSFRVEPWNASWRYVHRTIQDHVGFCDSMEFNDAVERIKHTAGSSSPGFRFNRFGRTKREVLENPVALLLLREEIEGADSTHYHFTASLKDELRDLEDGVPKDARLFFPIDLGFLLALVMVYGRFNDRFVDSRFCGSLGGSFLNGGADWMIKKLSRFSRFGEGDAHKFDSHQQQLLRQCVYEVRNSFVEHPLLAHVTSFLINPIVCMPDGLSWELGGHNPSGSFNTLVDNTILTLFVLAYSYYCKFPGTDLEEHLEMQAQGDDYLYSTDVEFTPSDVAECALDLGLDYDGGSLRSVGEISFCQHWFVLCDGVYVSRPDPARVIPSLVLNRCPSLFDTQLMVQSLLIEHFYNHEMRMRLRRFLDGPGWLSDSQIHWLHTAPFRYENAVAAKTLLRTLGERGHLDCSDDDWNEWNLNYQLVLKRHQSAHLCTQHFLSRQNQAKTAIIPRDQRGSLARLAQSPAVVNAAAAIAYQLARRGVKTAADGIWDLGASLVQPKRVPVTGERIANRSRPRPQPQPRMQRAQRPRPRRARGARKGKNPVMPGQMVKAPVARSRANRKASSTVYRSLPNGDLNIRRREYVGDVAAEATIFGLVGRYDINPTVAGSFLWLSRIAPNFQFYRFNRLRHSYVPQVATSETGYVLLACDYNINDNNYGSKIAALNSKGSVAGPAWSELHFDHDPADLGRRKTYSTSTKASQEAEIAYTGKFMVFAGSNNGGASNMGEIWVEYDVTLMTAQLNESKFLDATLDPTFRLTGSSNAAPFGTSVAEGAEIVTVAASGTTASTTTITFRQDWAGFVWLQFAGADLNNLQITGGTATETSLYSVDNNTTHYSFSYVDADAGETMIIAIDNTSISAATAYFMNSEDIRA